MVTLPTEYEIKFLVADGTPCFAFRTPETEWWYVVALENIRLAATTGAGHHRPGHLVCGYNHHIMENGLPSPGFSLGYFRKADLASLYEWGRAACPK